jgi:hypothetical protein
MADLYCPTCKAVYPAGTPECWRCKRPDPPGAPAVRTNRHSALLPVEAFVDTHEGVRAVEPPPTKPVAEGVKE